MKTFTAFLALVGIHAQAEEHKPLDQSRLLECVKMIEASPVAYVSPSGCRGIYQLSAGVWHQWSDKPHAWANSPDRIHRAITQNVALKHAYWIITVAIPALRLPATPYSFALLWKPGYGKVEKLNLSPANVDYARRFRNLYDDHTW